MIAVIETIDRARDRQKIGACNQKRSTALGYQRGFRQVGDYLSHGLSHGLMTRCSAPIMTGSHRSKTVRGGDSYKTGDRPGCPRGAKTAPWDSQVCPQTLRPRGAVELFRCGGRGFRTFRRACPAASDLSGNFADGEELDGSASPRFVVPSLNPMGRRSPLSALHRVSMGSNPPVFPSTSST